MHQMIAYGFAGTMDLSTEQKAAERWARGHGIEVLLWCREPAKTSKVRVEKRSQLHLALFCLRAGDAHLLWVPDWSVFGDAVARDLACAEAWSTGAVIVVDGEVVTPEMKTEQQQLAWAWVQLADRLDPRQTEPDDRLALVPDIGECVGEWHCARLAQKLRDDFKRNPDQTATYMNQTRYRTEAGEAWSGSSVQSLLGRHPSEPGLTSQHVLAEAGQAGLTALALMTFGPDAKELIPAATAYNEGLSRPFDHVFPIMGNNGLPNPKSLGLLDLKESNQVRQLLLGAGSGFVGCVYASAEEVFGESISARELVYANCWLHGVVVVIAGEPIDPRATLDEETMRLRQAARSAGRLRAILRAHDADSVRYKSLVEE
jgi:hypothetical protein